MTSGSQVHRGSDSRIVEFCMTLLTQAGSPLKASALRDIERGAPTEGEHVLGDMVARARSLGVETPILDWPVRTSQPMRSAARAPLVMGKSVCLRWVLVV